MNNFTYMNPTRIIFGKGAENQVGAETAAHAKKILLHYGSGSIKKSGLYDRVCASLKAAGVQWVELGGVVPNPRLALVHEGVKLCKENKLEMILAVGGGSVIDSAKAIAMGAVMDGDVWNYYIGKGQPAGALPVATVLTIPAAGSESSPGTVITNDEGMLKRAVNADCLFPTVFHPEPRAYLYPAPFPDSLRRLGHHGPPHGTVLHQHKECGVHRPHAGGHHEDHQPHGSQGHGQSI
jgi:alcohol dehydrogenase